VEGVPSHAGYPLLVSPQFLPHLLTRPRIPQVDLEHALRNPIQSTSIEAHELLTTPSLQADASFRPLGDHEMDRTQLL
jgi:hypothetical protein